MRILTHGIDKGSAILLALIINLSLSIFIIALVPRIEVFKRNARDYKIQVVEKIENENMEVINKYDLH